MLSLTYTTFESDKRFILVFADRRATARTTTFVEPCSIQLKKKVLLPKVEGSLSWKEVRPISIASMLYRLYAIRTRQILNRLPPKVLPFVGLGTRGHVYIGLLFWTRYNLLMTHKVSFLEWFAIYSKPSIV